jgi:hypothetical protein
MGKALNRFGRIMRETPCKLEYNDEETGEVKADEVTLRFTSLTTAEIRDRKAKARDNVKKGDTNWLADELIGVLTEVVEADGTKHKVTSELLETMAVENIAAMNNAIEEAVRPKEQPAK